jgi:acyl dehydratase
MGGSLSHITFDDVYVGYEVRTEARTITEADVVEFARLSGDYHPEHLDEEYARQGPHGARIAHGLLTLSVMTGMLNQTGLFEWMNIGVLDIKASFVRAVKFNDTLTTLARITYKRPTSKPDRGIVRIGATVTNQRGEPVLEAEWTLMLKR